MDAKLNTFHETTKKNVVEKENNPLIVNGLDPALQAEKTCINLAVPYGAARLNVPVCICKGIAPKVVKKTTLGDFIKSLSNGDPLSISTSESLKNAYFSYRATGDKKPYDAIKQGLNGVVFGEFSTRKDNDCTVYIGLMGLDIDGYNDPVDMSFDLSEFKKNPYVFAAFPSPSNHGLRVLVWTDSTFETHKATYKSLLSFMSNTLNISTDKDQKPHLDGATFNPSRLWFFTHTTDVYVNLDSQVFTPSVLAATDTQAATVATSKPAKSDVKKPHTHDGTLTDAQKIDACTEMSKQRNKTDGTHDRNNFVFNTACLCFEHGVTSDAILSHFTTAYSAEDFTAAEIKKTVNSAEKKAQFGIYTDAQLMKYIKNGDPSVSQPTATPGPVNKVTKATATPGTSSAATMAATPSVSKAKTPTIEPTTDGDASDDEDEFNEDFEGKTPKIVLIEQYLNKRYDLRNNVVSNDVEISKRGKNQFEPVNESELICELLRTGLNGVDKPLMSLLNSKYPTKYHPLMAYFETVNAQYQWKTGDIDHIGNLANHVKTTDQYFFNAQFKKMLVRVVACAIGKIPFNKQCLTFVGKQNDGKTSFVRFLMPSLLGDYIKENLDFDKDGRLALCQNLIINLDELASLSRNDINQVKTYFTVETVKDRPPYGKKPISFKRTASFFASTNNSEFLTDETGNVRWLVFEIDGFNFSYRQNVDIDAVWSQAYALLMSGFECQMTADEIAHSEMNNNRFKRAYIELELLQERFEPAEKDDEGAVFRLSTQMLTTLTNENTLKLNGHFFAKALREGGFKKVQNRQPNAKGNIMPTGGYWVIEKNSF